ncbi:hypothetical protein DNTS_015726 [Danionella cerebrum]|uniref:Uncharacterized protein n=1 Tax=Danionella cerebrum TaxID=2873325 RepID=A0A553QD30_9TELE|nr:hypothetical protein DNTS_015726 [Danionella translucida]
MEHSVMSCAGFQRKEFHSLGLAVNPAHARGSSNISEARQAQLVLDKRFSHRLKLLLSALRATSLPYSVFQGSSGSANTDLKDNGPQLKQ